MPAPSRPKVSLSLTWVLLGLFLGMLGLAAAILVPNRNYERLIRWFKAGNQTPLTVATRELLSLYPKPMGALWMLGDSHLSLLDWEKALNQGPVVNAGVPGERLEGLLARADSASAYQARQVVLMIGINDLLQGVSAEKLWPRYQALLDSLTHTIPAGVVMALFYTSHNEEVNHEVRLLNQKLSAYALPKGWQHLDLNPTLAPQGHLLYEYTYDGLHLNKAGYVVWLSALKPRLLTP